jgi:ATP-binding cassette, subfamily B, bacterial
MFLDGFRAAPGWMSAVTALLVLGSVAATCYPLGYRLLVDGALDDSASQVAWGVLVVGGLLSIGWVLTAIGAAEAMALSDRIADYRTRRLMRLISGVPGLEHLERPDYLSNVEQLNAQRRQLAAAPRLVLSNVSSLARIITLLVLLGSVSPYLLLLPLAAVPPLIADRIAKRISRRVEDDLAHRRRLAAMLFGLASDVGSAAEVRAYGLGDYLGRRHDALRREIDAGSNREAGQVLVIQAVGWLLYSAALMGAIAYIVVEATRGAMSIGTVLMTVSLIRRSRNQLASATQGSGALVATLTTADRLFWLEDHAAQAAERAGTGPAPEQLRDAITVRDVSFRYPGTDRVVLDAVDLRLPAGGTVAIIGENGSGKSTLVKLLLGLYQPDSGHVEVDGTDLAALAPEAWRARCASAFQDFSRLYLEVLESIGVADVDEIHDEPAAALALDRAGAAELEGQLPHGLRTEVGSTFTGGHGLSGGQWQKLALARAMRRADPLLLVLDEPTASLDAQSEHALFERYAEAARRNGARSGAITVLVSHRFSTVQMADLIVLLDAGRAVEVGSHEQLMHAGGNYAELFELQAAGYR